MFEYKLRFSLFWIILFYLTNLAHAEVSQVDSNFDGKIDVVRHYREGVVQREERDRDFDGRFELVNRYADGVLSQSSVHDGDLSAAWTVRVEYKAGRKTRQIEDRNRDGKTDLRSSFDEAGETILRSKDDADFDGHFETTRQDT